MSVGSFFTKSVETFLKQWAITDPFVLELVAILPKSSYSCDHPRVYGGFLRTIMEHRDKPWKEIQKEVKTYLSPKGKGGDIDIELNDCLSLQAVKKHLDACNFAHVVHGSTYSENGKMITAWVEDIRYEISWNNKRRTRPGLDFTCNELKYDVVSFCFGPFTKKAESAITTRSLVFGSKIKLSLLWRMMRFVSLGYKFSDTECLKALYKIDRYLAEQRKKEKPDKCRVRFGDLSQPLEEISTIKITYEDLLARKDFDTFYTELKFQVIQAVARK